MTSPATANPVAMTEPRSIASVSSTKLEAPAFVVNRNAGGFRRDVGLEGRIRRAASARGTVYATTTDDELERAVCDALERNASPIVFCGGDGTYLAGVTALVRAAGGGPLPVVGLARAGTVSIVAKNWRADRDVVRAVRTIVERPDQVRVTARPTLSVESDGVTRVGFTFGTGLVANFFEVYDSASPGGVRAALGIAVRAFVDSFRGGPYATKILSPLPCRITADGEALAPDAWSLVLCSVLRDVGLHMIVTYRAGEDRSDHDESPEAHHDSYGVGWQAPPLKASPPRWSRFVRRGSPSAANSTRRRGGAGQGCWSPTSRRG